MSDLTDIFEKYRQQASPEALEKLRQDWYVEASIRGSDEASIGGLVVNQGGRMGGALSTRKKEQRAQDAAIILTVLEQMRERLADLENQMAKRFEALKNKYLDDVIGGMASTFLDDKELSSLETDEQKLQALADKFLDETGNIREDYKGLEEAEYMHLWQQAEDQKQAIEQHLNTDKSNTAEQEHTQLASIEDSTNFNFS